MPPPPFLAIARGDVRSGSPLPIPSPLPVRGVAPASRRGSRSPITLTTPSAVRLRGEGRGEGSGVRRRSGGVCGQRSPHPASADAADLSPRTGRGAQFRNIAPRGRTADDERRAGGIPPPLPPRGRGQQTAPLESGRGDLPVCPPPVCGGRDRERGVGGRRRAAGCVASTPLTRPAQTRPTSPRGRGEVLNPAHRFPADGARCSDPGHRSPSAGRGGALRSPGRSIAAPRGRGEVHNPGHRSPRTDRGRREESRR